MFQILEKGEKENLCHKTSENVWKYGPRPKTVENEIQSKMQPEQKDEIAKNRRLASLRKKKIKSILRRQNKRTTKRSSKIYSNTNDSSQFNKEHGEKYVTEINSECVTGGLFRSTLKQTQLSQANRRPKRRRQRSTIAGRAFTREELLKILAELDEAESKNGSDQVKMKSDIKLKQRKSIRRGRGRGRGRVRGVSGKIKVCLADRIKYQNRMCYFQQTVFERNNRKEQNLQRQEEENERQNRNNLDLVNHHRLRIIQVFLLNTQRQCRNPN